MRYFKKLLLIILTGISMNVFGQVHSIGIQFGANLTNLTAYKSFEDSKFRTGIIVGFNYELLFKDKYSLGTDFLYSQQGFKDNMTFTDESGNIIRGNAETKFYYDYLVLPIKLAIQWVIN